MSIATELTHYNNGLLDAYTAVSTKGGTVPENKNLDNLPTAINSIPNGGGSAEPSDGAVITGYDGTTGVISGAGFGSTTGTVYLLVRETNSYVAQPTSSWSDSSITLTNPIDTTNIEGYTSMAVVDSNGMWSTKWLIQGDIALTGYGKVYVQDADTRVVRVVDFNAAGTRNIVGNLNSTPIKVNVNADDSEWLDEIVGYQLGPDYTSLSDTSVRAGYLRGSGLCQPVVLPNGITQILGNVFCDCRNFNQPIILPDTLTSIADSFLSGCFSFNQPIEFPETLTTIGANFLENCYSFNQKVEFHAGVTFGIGFMAACSKFNNELVLPSDLTAIPAAFMTDCHSFNRKFTIPNTVTTIGTNFMPKCYSYNQELVLPTSLQTIDYNFMSECKTYNKPLTLPPSLASVGYQFLYKCNSFNQPLTIPSSLTAIDYSFLRECWSFNYPLTIPSTVTSIGANFMADCWAFTNLTVNTTVSPTDNYTLACSVSNATQANSTKIVNKGVTLYGTGASTWKTNLPDRTTNPRRRLIDGTA